MQQQIYISFRTWSDQLILKTHFYKSRIDNLVSLQYHTIMDTFYWQLVNTCLGNGLALNNRQAIARPIYVTGC